MTPLVIGIVAHVDAGKTTLSEGLLFLNQTIRKMGRVDNGDTFLDTDGMEKARGITIFSKQARFTSHDGAGREHAYTLLDTPGHADFSPEMERTLCVLDLAVLVISAPEGINAQVRTLWRLLKHYNIPTVFFVNKMDQAEALGGAEAVREQMLSAIGKSLTDAAMPWEQIADPDYAEEVALLDEGLLERYMALEEDDGDRSHEPGSHEPGNSGGGRISDDDIRTLIRERKLYPVCFGAALKMQGVEDLMTVLDRWGSAPSFGEEFGARVFKITRDPSGERLTHIRLTGGSLKVRETITYESFDETPAPGSGEDEAETGSRTVSEKITQIRLYSGDRCDQTDEVKAGEICALTGLTGTYTGQGLGREAAQEEALIQPVLTWQIRLRMGDDPFRAYRQLKILAEEEPMLQVSYDERTRKITVRMMGRMQREMLADMAFQRFGLEIAFDQPSVIYKETVADAVEGVGHFEPLRHYAEVHVLIRPGEPGSGVVCDSELSTDVLARRWQNLALGALEGRRLRGVLTGSELTDVRITLVAGRAHEKHTEGGDFYQASHRAVRQGLMMARSVLLEPWYDVRIEVPSDNLGRVLTDITKRGGTVGTPEFDGDTAVVTGRVAVRALGDYADELKSFTKGQGHIDCESGPYLPCLDPLPIIEAAGYDPDADKRHPSASVFCRHGAGTLVPWYEVREWMHVDSGYRMTEERLVSKEAGSAGQSAFSRSEIDRLNEKEVSFHDRQKQIFAAEDELKAIFEKTYGPVKTHLPSEEAGSRVIRAGWNGKPVASSQDEPGLKGPAGGDPKYSRQKKNAGPQAEYLLVDGYNIIYAWPDLRDLAVRDIKAARDKLMEILSNFAGYSRQRVILVFDAYKVSGGQEHVMTHHNIAVIFTREAETADQYIEKTTHELLKNYRVTVATSDAVEQIIIFGAGARRLSARDLEEEVRRAEEEIRETYLETQNGGKYFLKNNLADRLEGLGLPDETGGSIPAGHPRPGSPQHRHRRPDRSP